jgi:hypothetical protein
VTSKQESVKKAAVYSSRGLVLYLHLKKLWSLIRTLNNLLSWQISPTILS